MDAEDTVCIHKLRAGFVDTENPSFEYRLYLIAAEEDALY